MRPGPCQLPCTFTFALLGLHRFGEQALGRVVLLDG
jgi:hypothetical protein